MLKVAEGARLCGASRIIGVDVNSDKFEIGNFMISVAGFTCDIREHSESS